MAIRWLQQHVSSRTDPQSIRDTGRWPDCILSSCCSRPDPVAERGEDGERGTAGLRTVAAAAGVGDWEIRVTGFESVGRGERLLLAACKYHLCGKESALNLCGTSLNHHVSFNYSANNMQRGETQTEDSQV